jgi:negative elongation factor B
VSNPSPLPADVIPVLGLLDLHDIRRSVMYHELVIKLREKLIPRLASLSKTELEHLLEKTFAYISIEELSSIPMEIMTRLNSINVLFLKELAKYEALYEKCPMKIKRQIWVVNYQLFEAQVMPVVEPFVNSNKEVLYYYDFFLVFVFLFLCLGTGCAFE